MPGMVRPKGKATDIALKILGRLSEVKQIRRRKKPKIMAEAAKPIPHTFMGPRQ